MQPIRTLMTTLLATSLASIAYARPPALAPANAAEPLLQQDEAKPQQDEQKKKETPDNKTPKTEKQDKTANQQKAADSQRQRDQDQKQDRNVARQDQAKQDQRENGGQGAKHGRIADKDYQTHFGQQHTFNVRTVVTTTTIVPNQTRFVYTGYTFVFVDPWPVGWAMGDDCYIDYIDGGYYMIDVVHPGVQIALTIVG